MTHAAHSHAALARKERAAPHLLTTSELKDRAH